MDRVASQFVFDSRLGRILRSHASVNTCVKIVSNYLGGILKCQRRLGHFIKLTVAGVRSF